MNNSTYIKVNKDQRWLLNNKLHREDGPAIEHANGNKEWYLNGKRHRDDGPAIERADGSKSWWLNDNPFGPEKPENWEELVRFFRVELIMNS